MPNSLNAKFSYHSLKDTTLAIEAGVPFGFESAYNVWYETVPGKYLLGSVYKWGGEWFNTKDWASHKFPSREAAANNLFQWWLGD